MAELGASGKKKDFEGDPGARCHELGSLCLRGTAYGTLGGFLWYDPGTAIVVSVSFCDSSQRQQLAHELSQSIAREQFLCIDR